MEDVEQLAESLAMISGSVQSIIEMSLQIATASEEQSAVAEEINRSIVNINDLADQTTTVSRQAFSEMNKLLEQTEDLHTLVNRFSGK